MMTRRLILLFAISAGLIAPVNVFGAFGLDDSNPNHYRVDTGSGLVFNVSRNYTSGRNNNGDITSLIYNGVEYQDRTRFSQVNSGLGLGATVTAEVYGGQYIKITVTAGALTHYYLVRNGYNNIYMATYFKEEPSIGLVRYIVRIPSTLLPDGPPPSDVRGNIGAIEASDIFRMPDGTSRSKHYSNNRLIDWRYTGATGTGVGVFMVRSNHEGDSGGPFYRSLINQCGSDQEIYEIVNYGEAQTEPFRLGVLNGPYVLTFTDGSSPSLPMDKSWIGGLNLTGWVRDRGRVTGAVSGIPDGFQAVVGFANSTAQYWASVSSATFTSPRIIPGDYNVTLYKGELAVATSSVTVPASKEPVTLNLTSNEPTPPYIWKIGEWDGTPFGFFNADKVTYMHPSDVRMNDWAPATFTIGVDDPAISFPCYQWKGVNNPTTIYFDLTPDQIANHTLRIGITTAYAGGRPQVTVNSWTSNIPSPSRQPNSRTLTVGTYRGNNTTFTYNIPASAFVVGTNTMTLSVVSGSGGTGFLSPGYSYDAVELD